MARMASSRKQEDPLIAMLRDAVLWDEVEIRLSGGGAQASAASHVIETSDDHMPGSPPMTRGLPDSVS